MVNCVYGWADANVSTAASLRDRSCCARGGRTRRIGDDDARVVELPRRRGRVAGDADHGLQRRDQVGLGRRLRPHHRLLQSRECAAAERRVPQGDRRLHALSDCNESLRIRPNDAETLSGRGFAYLRLGFYRTAIRDYDAALEFKPDTAMYLYARGLAKMEAGFVEGGEADIAAARSLDAKIDAKFEAYDAASEGGFWSAMVGYWRAAMKWLY
jgi:tetratricopeptide (TPR) repeat protein